MIKRFRRWIENILGFSKVEANGVIVLIIAIFAFAIIPRILIVQYRSKPISSTQDLEVFEMWVQETNSAISTPTKKIDSPSKASKVEVHYFRFDPNTASVRDLISLGFSTKTAENISKYRQKGGAFRLKSDLKKIYGISEETLTELNDFIELPDTYVYPDKNHTEGKVPKKEKPIVRFELNQATSQNLQKIRGIGQVLSTRVIKFRDKLGGFHSPEQLYEVYGLDSIVVEELRAHAYIDSKVSVININTDSLKTLYLHPYIDYNTAKTIFAFKQQHGDFKSIDEIQNIKIISDSLYKKIYPYLSINP